MTALDVDTSTIEHLDFVPCCEHSRHRRPGGEDAPSAQWLLHSKCPSCSLEDSILLCRTCRWLLFGGALRDNSPGGCGRSEPAGDWILLWTPIVEVQ